MGFFSSDTDSDDEGHGCPGEGHRADPGFHFKRSHGEYRSVEDGEARRGRRCQKDS